MFDIKHVAEKVVYNFFGAVTHKLKAEGKLMIVVYYNLLIFLSEKILCCQRW